MAARVIRCHGWLVVSLVVLGGVSGADDVAQVAISREASSVRGLGIEYEADRNDVRRSFGPSVSRVSQQRLETLDRDYLERLATLDFDGLDHREQVDYLVLRTQIASAISELVRYREQLADSDAFVPFRSVIESFQETMQRVEPVDCQEAATRVASLARQVEKTASRVEAALKRRDRASAESEKDASTDDDRKETKDDEARDDALPKLTPPLVSQVVTTVQSLQRSLKDWHEHYRATVPAFSWWVDDPYNDANKQLDRYVSILRQRPSRSSKKDDRPEGTPLGATALAERMRLEWLAYSADELIDIAERELAWCERELRRASSEMGFSDDWLKALAKVKEDYVPAGEQAELVATIGREATAFVKSRDLVTIPKLCEASWSVEMLSADAIRSMPYAAYSDSRAMVAYAASAMKHDDKISTMQSNNRHFMRLIVPHEIIPGHHLEAFYRARLDEPNRLGTPFFTEGWAMYWELRLWDLGWAATPEDRIGMLFWRAHRAARVIVSLSYHLGRMDGDDMIRFLIERVGHEKFAATSEVRRYMTFPPLYQAGYLIGALQFLALEREAVESGLMTERAFHDAVLKSGNMPIELLRMRLLETPTTRDAQPTWRFYDALAERD